MVLTIDVGNTRAKLVAFDVQGNVCRELAASIDDLKHAIRQISGNDTVEGCVWCNVGSDDRVVEDALADFEFRSIKVTGTTEVPVKVAYQSRATLGADRLAAVVGGVTKYPHNDLLIVDAGTCVTFDLVTAEGVYLGGNISPGIEMRLQALHERTARLPRVAADGAMPEIGRDTETAIRCGVVQGLAREIEGYVHYWQQRFPRLLLLQTGGSVINWEMGQVKCIADAYLVSAGLLRVWQEKKKAK